MGEKTISQSSSTIAPVKAHMMHCVRVQPKKLMADNEGENQIVHKLADSCGNVGSAGIDGEALVFPDGSADVPVYEVIYDSGNEEGDRASEKHIPGSAEGVVQGGVYDCFGPVYIGFAPDSRDQAAEIEDQTHPEIDSDGDHAEHRGRFGPKRRVIMSMHRKMIHETIMPQSRASHEKGRLILLFASRFMEIVATINTVTVSEGTLRSRSFSSARSPWFFP